MKTYLDNLRPFERRVVIFVGALLFVVLNFWFVFPHFSDWSKLGVRMNDANDTLAKYQAEIEQKPTYDREIRKLESEGYSVPAEDQGLHFSSAVQSQAAQSHVRITQQSKITDRTNQFFLEKSQMITAEAGEPELVDFLFSLGAGNSLIRVRDLSLRPDPPRQNLQANLKLVASYQKNLPKPAATRAPAAAGKTTAGSAKTAPAPSAAATKTNPTAKRP